MQFVDVPFTLTDFWRYNSKYSILGDHRVQISWNYELCIFAVTFLDMHETRDSVHVQSPQWSFGDRCPVCSWCPAQVHCSPPGLSCTLSGSGRGSGGQLLGLPASSGAAWSGPQRSSWLGPPLASYGSGFHNLEDVNKEWVLEVFCILIKDQQWFHYELSGIMVTLGHEEGDSESTLCNSLSECRQAGSIEWKRAADQNIQHNTKALCRKQWASAVCPNVNAYSLNQANFIFPRLPKCPAEDPHTLSLQTLQGQHKAGCHTTLTEALLHCRSFQIRNLQEMDTQWLCCSNMFVFSAFQQNGLRAMERRYSLVPYSTTEPYVICDQGVWRHS